MLTEKQLAERGAVIALQEMKAEIQKLYDAYPGLLLKERLEKRKQTMLDKYGTLNPHEAKAKGAAKPKAKVNATGAAGPKKSHHKKKPVAPEAQPEPEFTALPVAEGAEGAEAGLAEGQGEPDVIEMVEEVGA